MSVLGGIFLVLAFAILQISAMVVQSSPQPFHPVFLEHPHVINKRQANQPIRITPIYDTDAATSFLTPQQRTYVENIIMANITNFFSSLLSVKPFGVPIRSPRTCTGRPITAQVDDGSFAM